MKNYLKKGIKQNPKAFLIWKEWDSDIPSLPKDAICGGIDLNGDKFYIGRALHANNVLPAKIIPNKKGAFVTLNGQEFRKTFAQILTDPHQNRFEWVEKQGGIIPRNSIKGGSTDLGEPLFIGRTWLNGSRTLGKIHPSHGCLYVPFNGKELSFKRYEIFVKKDMTVTEKLR